MVESWYVLIVSTYVWVDDVSGGDSIFVVFGSVLVQTNTLCSAL